ncbi:PP2C family protein-serine/threonine phosphatase [Roseinatronobacter alkalisoli]|uniref:Protein phosphatase 2C domain-containing protein n=1 Tax=Roseinatronobacter alkalisoli TaxID=3028235 RepID=A0ABT5TCS7_9RHOB|nr:protein phosphatase 2C domain-containing protein [Roseinatronobacter sp. HJB301]MDD7971942.1 protein phosphatase 2C domain-containing protein [Roseinatronobacter sp. HJB301]
MPNPSYRFETGAATHGGRVRDHNEDRYLAAPDQGIWLVADGMGGHFGGDVAAQIMVDQAASVHRAATAPDLHARFHDRIARANEDIRAHSLRNEGATIGTTLAALLIHDNSFVASWCGDSRIYLLREGTLHQVSRDHTEVQELLDTGAITAEQARHWPRKNVITRAIGVHEDAHVEDRYGDLQDRDIFLLCSDGLTGHVDDDEIAASLRGQSAQRACETLLNMTLDRGASDNVTIIVIRCAFKTLVTRAESNSGETGKVG